MEVERKFLIRNVPYEATESHEIEQGYLALTDSGTEVRIRRWDDQAALTVKHGSGEVRTEVELRLDADQLEELWPLTEGARVSKRRLVVQLPDHQVEVDLYQGELEGLRVAEVEFESEAEAEAFEPPDWFGREVTEDGRYSNERLAHDGAPG